MKIQPITSQPNSKGKVRCINCIGTKDGFVKIPDKVTKNRVFDLPSGVWNKLNEIVENEPYDIFIHPNLKNDEFFNVDAGTSFQEVLNSIQGKVKVRYDTLEALPLAIKDAARNYENSLSQKIF